MITKNVNEAIEQELRGRANVTPKAAAKPKATPKKKVVATKAKGKKASPKKKTK